MFYAIKGKHIHFTKQCEFLQFLTINQYKLDYKVRNMLMRGCLFVFFLNANIFVKSSLRCCSYCNFECISNRKYLKTQMCEKIDVFIKKITQLQKCKYWKSQLTKDSLWYNTSIISWFVKHFVCSLEEFFYSILHFFNIGYVKKSNICIFDSFRLRRISYEFEKFPLGTFVILQHLPTYHINLW